jgi:3-hydroxyisobutyrate dehydrogenase
MIGLGKMGLPLSRQMMKDGHTVCGYDIDPERMLKEEGGTPLASAKEVAQRAEAAGWGKDDASRVIQVYEGKDKAR